MDSPADAAPLPSPVADAALPAAPEAIVAHAPLAANEEATATAPPAPVSASAAESETAIVSANVPEAVARAEDAVAAPRRLEPENPAPAVAPPARIAAMARPKPATASVAPARRFADRAWRFAEGPGMKVAGIIVASGLGWVIGANTFDTSKATSGRLVEAVNALHTRLTTLETHAGQRVSREDLAKLRAAVTQVEARLEKNRSDRSAALTQMSAGVDKKLAEATTRVGDAATKASETGARVDTLATRLDKLERDVAASRETTASIPKPAPVAEAKVPAKEAAAVNAREAAARKETSRAMPGDGWVLRKVRNGVAFVENAHGVREVGPGDRLPGVGRVEQITRRNGQWVVVTSNGLIDSQEY